MVDLKWDSRYVENIYNANGITIKQLKELVKDLQETDPDSGEDYEVWIDGTDCKPGLSNIAKSITRLNRGDIIIEIA